MTARWLVVGRAGGEDAVAVALDADGVELWREPLTPDLAARYGDDDRVRWVWSDTARRYPPLLAAGIRVARCHDLRLCRAILRSTAQLAPGHPTRLPSAWDAAAIAKPTEATLFDLDEAAGPPDDVEEVVAELRRQLAAVDDAAEPGRLRLLLAAESAGALTAAELHAVGLPWDAGVHNRLLTEALGARPPRGGLPEQVSAHAAAVRAALGDPDASLDSQPKLLRSLHRAGVLAASTSRWELARFDHPVVAPLLAYKKLTRLLSANGWAWLDEWVRDSRFRPVYVPAGVVTGRWASAGGGALQIPRQLRPAVRADPGWVLVSADVAQLEPRVLAAMSRDRALTAAARGTDLYAGIVGTGIVTTRQEAKIAMLGALYGATTGDSGRLVPALRRAFGPAMGMVDSAARDGEAGTVVSTWLGRTSPPPGERWRALQRQGSEADATDADRARARRAAADRGRFTRNFIVQGTAAEWALAWLADLRARLWRLGEGDGGAAAPASGVVFARRPHLAFFLHDEVIVHAPAALAEAAADAVRESAASAGRVLFGDFRIDFPLDVRIAADAAKE